MTLFAQVQNGTVINIIVAEQDFQIVYPLKKTLSGLKLIVKLTIISTMT